MALTPPLSGKLGRINGVGTVRNWSIDESVEITPLVASNTICGTDNVPGVRSWSGSFSVTDKTQLLAWLPGKKVDNCVFFMGPEDNTEDSQGPAVTGSVRVDNLTLNFDLSTNAPLSVDVAFTGHGAMTRTLTQADVDDTTEPAIYLPCEAIIPPVGDNILAVGIDTDGTGTTFEKVDNFQSYVLSLTSENSTYVDESTVVSNVCWQGTLEGPKNWELSIVRNHPDVAKYAIGIIRQIKLYTDSAENWLLKWGIAGGTSGPVVDIESGAILQYTQTWHMRAVNPGSGGGQVAIPGGGVWWEGGAAA